LESPFRQRFIERKHTHLLDSEAINEFREFAGMYVVIVFSEQWCKDCARHVPVLALISESTELRVRIFGGLKKDTLSTVRKWMIPPSPHEVETFGVDRPPLIVIVNRRGEDVGRIAENLKQMPPLEEELLTVVRARNGF
jgi:hypothetical protein